MGRGPRETCRILGMGPNTERKYRRALSSAGLLSGDPDDLPDLEALSLAVTEPGSRHAGTVLTMYGETLLLNGGIVAMLKGLVNRTRPYAYNDDPDISMEQRTSHDTVLSFPSGHTANAFAAAVFMSTVYGRLHPDGSGRAWVWVGSLTAAAGVGYLRYAAGKHYPTDIIAGAVIGSLVGWLVPKLHEQDITAPGDPATKGFSLSYGFRF